MALPPLRPMNVFPMEHEGHTYICLSDPSGVVEEQILVPPLAYFMASQFDGAKEALQVVEACRKAFDQVECQEADVLEVTRQLNERGYLLSNTFFAMADALKKSFAALETRPPFLAGKSYPAEPEACRTFLDEQFLREGGPGEALPSTPGTGAPLKGLIVPHIDMQRGGHLYAHGYRRLYAGEPPDTVFIFGVAHQAEPTPFVLTRKHFETPLGLVETDLDFVKRLECACDGEPYEHELLHRTEHSIEFQVLMLAHLFGSNVKIVPVLCSMFSEDPSFDEPESLASVETFLVACRECVNDRAKKVLVIAAADLAHVGRRFGDDYDIDDDVTGMVRARDQEDMEHVRRVSASDFYGSVMKDANQRKVCGINCIYSALKSLQGTATRGEPIHYDFAHDPNGGIVSFASVALV